MFYQDVRSVNNKVSTLELSFFERNGEEEEEEKRQAGKRY